MAVSELTAPARAWLAALPCQTRTAFRWDLTTGALAGLYQGCIWTFVLRVARAELHATGPQMGWISGPPVRTEVVVPFTAEAIGVRLW